MDLDLSGNEALLERKAEHFRVPPPPTNNKTDSTTSLQIKLLPRLVEWLSTQARSPSAVMRKLIDRARHVPRQQIEDIARHHQTLTYRFCQALCGDLPNYEDAIRALLASDENGFKDCIGAWPRDLAGRAQALTKPLWQAASR